MADYSKILSFVVNHSKSPSKSVENRCHSIWQEFGIENLPHNFVLVIMDTAYCCGRERTVRWLQSVLPVVVNGRIDTYTLRAIARKLAYDFSTCCLLIEIVLLNRQLYSLEANYTREERDHTQDEKDRIQDLRKILEDGVYCD